MNTSRRFRRLHCLDLTFAARKVSSTASTVRHRYAWIIAALLACAIPSHFASAATVIWTAASGTDTNWSNGANWSGAAAPTGADDVKFFDTGTNLTIGLPNTFVDGAFTGSIGSLQLGQTNGFHTIAIATGQTLNITNGHLNVGTSTDINLVRNLTNTFVGAGTLNFDNTNFSLILAQGSAGGLSGLRANLNLSGLDNFTMNGSRIGLGTTTLPNPGNANQREAAFLTLAKTNVIRLSYAVPLNTYLTSAAATNAIEMSHNAGNNAGILSLLYLGQTNVFYIDSISAGRTKASATSAGVVQFNPSLIGSSPVAFFRGVGGNSSRVTRWSIADMCTAASSAQVSVGTNNFTGGTVNALIDTLSLARDTTASHTATPNIVGVLTFDSGVIDAHTVYAGNQSIGPSGSSTPLVGIINVNGTGLLTVNSNLVLGRTTLNSIAANRTTGILNINGGTVRAASIGVGSFSTNNVISMTNATLVVSNSIGAAGFGVTRFAISNSLLQFSVSGATNAYVTNLVTGGATNFITIGSAAVLPSYPTQVTLVKYVGAIAGAGFNFGLNPLPPTAIGYLSNNTANASIDLVLTTDPRPVIIDQPVGTAVDPGTTVNFTVNASGAPTLGYQWLKDGTNITDVGSFSGTTTSNLTVTSAQTTENGNYSVVINNDYGSVTSSAAILFVSAGDVAPFISVDPQSQTILFGQGATFSVSGAAKPLPTYQWLKDNVVIPNATNTSYSLVNTTLSDEAGYSVILSNSVNSITSAVATLTVNIPPVITNQPVSTSVLNGGSASFTVVAGGKPTPTYQWLKNTFPVTDATNATLTLNPAVPTDAGTYAVVVINSAGTATSTNVTLIVNSSMTISSLFPANLSSGICVDTPLKITFSTPPVLGNAGKIRIFNATNTATPVDTIDIGTSAPNGAQPRLIAGATYNTYPVFISGNTATIYPHLNVLTTNQTYYVTIENVVNGTFKDGAGATFTGISATNVWRFTTKPTGPANATNIVIAADGSGDFNTVQGAIDFVPAANITPRTLNIRNGVYQEIVYVNQKNNLTFIGQDRNQTIITYPNNDSLNGGTSLRPSFRLQGNDNALINLTSTNATPRGGSQAEALRTDGRRIVVFHTKLASFQDTMLNNNNGDLVYVEDTLIQGDTDFIWGGGTTFLTNSEIRCLSSGSHITQARTAADTNGFSFVNSFLTRGSNTVTGCDFGRSLGFADGNVAFIGCQIDDHIIGWADSLARSWEFGNSNLPPVMPVAYNGVQLTNNDPRMLLAINATNWLYGWAPQVLPLILTNPASLSVAGGATAVFTVTAIGVPAPSYQWLKNGTNLTGQTGVTLTINSANVNDAGTYSVIVSNTVGSVTSTTATLTVGNTAPTLSLDGTSVTINVGEIINFGAAGTDPDVPIQSLTYSLTSGPTNATINPTSGMFYFRPEVWQSDTTNLFTFQVTDDGAPNLSDSKNYTVVVNPLTQPLLNSSAYTGGQFSLSVNGQVGPDYAIQVSTNLSLGGWVTLYTTSSVAMPFTFVDTNANSAPIQFYRVIVGPPLP